MSTNFEEWVIRARKSPIELEIAHRGIQLRRVGVEHIGPCPRCGGVDRFSINTCKQLWNCRGCYKGGDVIDLVQYLDGVSFSEAIGVLTDERIPAATMPAPKSMPKSSNDDAERLRRADAIWQEATGIAGTPGATWLASRGIDITVVPEFGGLRFHPRCPWGHGETPCIVARFTDVLTNTPLGIHRRQITVKEKPRSLGSTAGGVIRLWPDENVITGLVIGEGVETTLAAATRIEHRGTLLQPAWACGSALTLERFPVLPGIEALTILVDHDRPDQHGRHAGQYAAQRCAKHWIAAGREVEILLPRATGADFNDIALTRK